MTHWHLLFEKYQYFFSVATHFKSSFSIQVENCDINSRLVVDEDYNGNFRLTWLSFTDYLCDFRQRVFGWLAWSVSAAITRLFSLSYRTYSLPYLTCSVRMMVSQRKAEKRLSDFMKKCFL